VAGEIRTPLVNFLYVIYIVHTLQGSSISICLYISHNSAKWKGLRRDRRRAASETYRVGQDDEPGTAVGTRLSTDGNPSSAVARGWPACTGPVKHAVRPGTRLDAFPVRGRSFASVAGARSRRTRGTTARK